jgi:hypothetical protein
VSASVEELAARFHATAEAVKQALRTLDMAIAAAEKGDLDLVKGILLEGVRDIAENPTLMEEAKQ